MSDRGSSPGTCSQRRSTDLGDKLAREPRELPKIPRQPQNESLSAPQPRRRLGVDSVVAELDREPHVEPVNKLDETERQTVLATLNSDWLVDAAPTQVCATLLAEGCYLCSI